MGEANPLMDRRAVSFLEWLQWSPHPQLQDVVWCSEAQCNCNCNCGCSCSCSGVDVVEVVEVVMLSKQCSRVTDK